MPPQVRSARTTEMEQVGASVSGSTRPCLPSVAREKQWLRGPVVVSIQRNGFSRTRILVQSSSLSNCQSRVPLLRLMLARLRPVWLCQSIRSVPRVSSRWTLIRLLRRRPAQHSNHLSATARVERATYASVLARRVASAAAEHPRAVAAISVMVSHFTSKLHDSQ